MACIDRAGYALDINNQLKEDTKDVETLAHQGEDKEDDVYYYNTKAATYEKLTQDILIAIEEGQLIL